MPDLMEIEDEIAPDKSSSVAEHSHCLFWNWEDIVYKAAAKSGNVVLVSGKDGIEFRVDLLILAAASSTHLLNILQQHHNHYQQDDVLIVLPDCTGPELHTFIQYLYCIDSTDQYILPKYLELYLDKKFTFNSQSLQRRKQLDDPTELEKVISIKEESETISNIRYSELKGLIKSKSLDVTYLPIINQAAILCDNFLLVSIQGVPTRYMVCKDCSALLKVPDDDSKNLAVIKKHLKRHKGHNNGHNTNDSKYNLEPSATKIELSSADLDIPVIQSGKENISSVQISKLAVEKLLEENSSRLSLLSCNTEDNQASPVWQNFHKMLLDGRLMPYVSCTICKQVYPFHRDNGTSGLLRHICYSHRLKTNKEKNRELLKELIRSESARVKYLALDDKFDIEMNDMSTVFTRVRLDNSHTDFIACKYCLEIFEHGSPSPPVPSQSLVSLLENHGCYLTKATCFKELDISRVKPDNPRNLKIILLHAPQRIKLRNKIENEISLYKIEVDGRLSNYSHCFKCKLFFLQQDNAGASWREAGQSEEYNNIGGDNRINKVHKCRRLESSVESGRGLSCHLCHLKFKSKHFHEIHMRQVHSEGQARVLCTYCGKDFATAGLARKHEQHIHNPDMKKHSCLHPGCNMTFVERNKLAQHAKVHNTGKKPYVCDVCGKGFNWSSSFKDHKDMHAGKKKFACTFCGKTFIKRNTFNNHQRLHTGEKPFMCPAAHCGMLFVQRTACKTHAKKKHNIDITVYTRNPAVRQTAASLAQTEKIKGDNLITTEENRTIVSETTTTKTYKPDHMITKDMLKSLALGGGEGLARGGGESLARGGGESLARGGGSLTLGGGLSKNLVENQLEISADLLAKLQNDGQVEIQLSHGQVVHIIPLSNAEFSADKESLSLRGLHTAEHEDIGS